MRKNKRKAPRISGKGTVGLKDVLSVYSELANLKKAAIKSAEAHALSKKRFLDIEIRINLLTRLLTTLCVENLGIRAPTLKRVIKRIEKEAFRDSQIMELESLYSLTNPPQKKTSPSSPKGKSDPWEQIS